MKFLTKLGQILVKATQIVTGFGPLVQQFVPVAGNAVAEVTSDLDLLAQIISNVEAVGQVTGLTGPDKLKAATPLVAQAILASSMLAKHKIADASLFNQGAQKIADGMADVLNSLKDDISTEDKLA
jgi:hypothetical protein